MYNITAVLEEVNAANNIKLATFRALKLKWSAMPTITTDNTDRRLGWSYGIFSSNRRCAAFTSHEMKYSSSDLLLVTNSKEVIINLNYSV